MGIIIDVPAKKLIQKKTSVNLVVGDNIKITVNDQVVDNLNYTVPEGKKASIRLEIRGIIQDE